MKWTGLTPSDYIRRLRLSNSAVILRDEDKKIIDIAAEMGFGSVDGYQRAFLREFGCNPSEYSENLFHCISSNLMVSNIEVSERKNR